MIPFDTYDPEIIDSYLQTIEKSLQFDTTLENNLERTKLIGGLITLCNTKTIDEIIEFLSLLHRFKNTKGILSISFGIDLRYRPYNVGHNVAAVFSKYNNNSEIIFLDSMNSPFNEPNFKHSKKTLLILKNIIDHINSLIIPFIFT